MNPDDAELMRRWQEGDVSAFEAVVRRWQQPVGRILARLVGRTELVQDLCQEVFLKVYHSGPRYRETGAFATWIYRITLNVARDAGRRRRQQPAPLSNQEPADHGKSPAAHCQQQETVREVARAVAELP